MKKPEIHNPLILEPISGKKVHLLQLNSIRPLKLGTEEKFKIIATLHDKKLYFVVREITLSYLETWKTLKQAGLPVIPMLRIANDLLNLKKTFDDSFFAVIPDLTADGSKLYGKSLAVEVMLRRYEPNQLNDSLFFNIMFNQFPKIVEATDQIVNIANQNDIFLPLDNELGELLIHPNGTWEIVMVDIELAITKINYWESNHKVERINQITGQKFLEYLQNIFAKYEF
jgi:hypothetical protein